MDAGAYAYHKSLVGRKSIFVQDFSRVVNRTNFHHQLRVECNKAPANDLPILHQSGKPWLGRRESRVMWEILLVEKDVSGSRFRLYEL